jgi:hypothetical protein
MERDLTIISLKGGYRYDIGPSGSLLMDWLEQIYTSGLPGCIFDIGRRQTVFCQRCLFYRCRHRFNRR